MTRDYAVKGTQLFFTSATSAFTAIGQVHSIDAPGITMGKRKATHLLSSLQEYRPTMGDPGEYSGTVVFSNQDDPQRIARSRLTTVSTIFDSCGLTGCDEFKLVTLSPTTALWRHFGFISKWDIKGGDEQGTWMADFSIQVASTIIEPTS